MAKGRTLGNLDGTDRRIIAALQAEGRRAFRSIAEELDVSESLVRYRVQRLEDAGILQVVGIADPLKIGFDLMAMVGVKIHPGTVNDVCVALGALPETSYVAAVAGSYDVLVELVCRDTAHFQEILNDGLHSIAGVASTESFLILEIHKMAYGWGAGDRGVPLAATEPDDAGPGSGAARPPNRRPPNRRPPGPRPAVRTEKGR